MAWIKVPPENHAIFLAALPKDPRVETIKMFGGVAAKVNGHIFAGLFGRSRMLRGRFSGPLHPSDAHAHEDRDSGAHDRVLPPGRRPTRSRPRGESQIRPSGRVRLC
jgi:hypothetical protein